MRKPVAIVLCLLSLKVYSAGFHEKLHEKIDRVALKLGVKIILNSDACDTWNAVTYDEETAEPVLSYYLDLLRREYTKYPSGFLPQADVQTLVLTKNLKFSGQSRAAVPDPYKKQLFLSVDGAYGISSERYLVHVMHHELHHCTEYSIWKSMAYDWSDWILLNEDGFCYGNGGASAYTDYINKGTDFYTPSNPQKGFINRYSLTGDEEDRAELMAFIMTDFERPLIVRLYRDDEIIRKKTAMLIGLLSEFTHQAIKFPEIDLSGR